MSTVTTATRFTQRFVDALEAHDVEEIVALYAPNGSQIHPFATGTVEGLDAIRDGDGALVRAFPDVTVTIVSEARTGDTVFIEAELNMTHGGPLELEDGTTVPPSGRPVRLPVTWVIDLDGQERIVQERSYLDPSAFFAQLGLQA